MGDVGLGDAALQLGHPHLRVRLAVPRQRQLPARRHRGAERRRRLACSRTADAATGYCQGSSDLAEWYGWATFAAGILVLLLAPVLGQRADARRQQEALVIGGHDRARARAVRPLLRLLRAAVLLAGAILARARMRWCPRSRASTTTRCSCRSRPADDRPGQRSRMGPRLHRRHPRPRDRRRPQRSSRWFGLDTSNGLAYRLIAVGAAVWTVVFALPLVFNVPEAAAPGRPAARWASSAATSCSSMTSRRCSSTRRARRSGSSSPARCTATDWPGCSPSAAIAGGGVVRVLAERGDHLRHRSRISSRESRRSSPVGWTTGSAPAGGHHHPRCSDL